MSILTSMLGARIAVNKTARSYQEVIDESEKNNRLWQQANNKLKAENRKHVLLMRAERASRMGWQQYAVSAEAMLVDAGETIESITTTTDKIIEERKDVISRSFTKEQDRIEREVEAALEKERNGG